MDPMTLTMSFKSWQKNSFLILIQSNLSGFMFLILLFALDKNKGSAFPLLNEILVLCQIIGIAQKSQRSGQSDITMSGAGGRGEGVGHLHTVDLGLSFCFPYDPQNCQY